MGEARRRGTFAERKQNAILAGRGKLPKVYKKAPPSLVPLGGLTRWLMNCIIGDKDGTQKKLSYPVGTAEESSLLSKESTTEGAEAVPVK